MKKNLIVLSNENVANQIILFCKSLKMRCEFDVIIYEKNQSKSELSSLNKLASILRPNKIIYVKEIPDASHFSIRNIFSFLKYKKNKFYYQKIKSFLMKKKINIINYHMIFFSNENINKYLLFKNSSKKFFFAHAPNDILLLDNKNILSKIKNNIECFINNNFMYNFNKIEKNYKHVSIFSNYSKQKNISEIIISPNKFKTFFTKNSKYSFKISNKKIALVDFTFPYKHWDDMYDNEIISKFLTYFFNNCLNKIFIDKNYLYLVKFKNYIPIKIQKKILKKIINKFPNYQIKILDYSIKKNITIEKLIINLKIIQYYTSFSTSMFYSRILNKNLKIFDYTNLVIEFWNNNMNKIKTKKNFKNLKLMRNKYLKIAKNI